MLVNYQKEDYMQVLVLWQEAFGDTKEDIDTCLALFAPYLYVYKQDEKVLSMLMLLPVSYNGKNGEYIYAVATKKEARNMGLATKMLEEVKRRKTDFFVLVPAEKSLFDFYKARGFTAGSPLKTIMVAPEAKTENIEITKISAVDYYNLRKAHFPTLAAWAEKMLSDIETLYGDCYYELKSANGHGFCMAYIQKDELTVSELCLTAIADADALSALCERFGAKKATAKLPDKNGEPFAMFYPESYADLYFNLAIN